MDQLLLYRLTRAEVDYDRQERTCYRFVCTHVGCRSQAAVVISTNGQVITRIDESVHNHDLLAGCVNQITEFTDEALANWLDDDQPHRHRPVARPIIQLRPVIAEAPAIAYPEAEAQPRPRDANEPPEPVVNPMPAEQILIERPGRRVLDDNAAELGPAEQDHFIVVDEHEALPHDPGAPGQAPGEIRPAERQPAAHLECKICYSNSHVSIHFY